MTNSSSSNNRWIEILQHGKSTMEMINHDIANGNVNIWLPQEIIVSIVIPTTILCFLCTTIFYLWMNTQDDFLIRMGLIDPDDDNNNDDNKENDNKNNNDNNKVKDNEEKNDIIPRQQQQQSSSTTTATSSTSISSSSSLSSSSHQHKNNNNKNHNNKHHRHYYHHNHHSNHYLLEKRRVAYAMTNLGMILILTIWGIWVELVHIQQQSFWTTTTTTTTPPKTTTTIWTYHEKTIGFINENDLNYSCLYLSAIQLGWQLWALPIGIYHVSESTSILLHHIAVIQTTFMTSCLYVGYRYYVPYFYGVIELSSIPLILMNLFKQRPKWKQQYTKLYLYIRIVFAILFIPLRIIYFTPRHLDLVRIKYWNLISHPILWLQIFYGSVFIGGCLLLVLQYYWAILILKGFILVLLKQQEQEEDDNDDDDNNKKQTTKNKNNFKNEMTTTTTTTILSTTSRYGTMTMETGGTSSKGNHIQKKNV